MDATRYAVEVPFSVMQLACDSLGLIRKMAEIGNPNSVTDAGVGALCARTAVIGAYLNVKINLVGYADSAFVEEMTSKGQALVDKAVAAEKEILAIVDQKIK